MQSDGQAGTCGFDASSSVSASSFSCAAELSDTDLPWLPSPAGCPLPLRLSTYFSARYPALTRWKRAARSPPGAIPHVCHGSRQSRFNVFPWR